MPALNSSTFTSWANGLSASGWQTFSDALASDWLGAWSAHFTLTTRWQTALGAISSAERESWVHVAAKMSSAITAGLPVAAVGTMFDISPASTAINNIQSGVRLEYTYADLPGIGLAPCAAHMSVWVVYRNEQA